jgi:hypothetical protein
VSAFGLGVESMQWSETTLRFTCLAILGLGLGGSTYFLPYDVNSAQSRERTPTEMIAVRFPADWDIAPPQPSQIAATFAAQRVASTQTVHTEAPYALASADSRSVRVGPPARAASPQEQALPTAALAYAPSVTETAIKRRAPAAVAVERAAVAPPQHERRAALAPVPQPVKQSSNVFTDSQIAGIKAKLKLSTHQQLYWPAVASALRKIDYVRQAGGKSPSIDPNSPGVQQLKSAAFPLIMSFDEEQKSQVRQLARNMGLEEVASAF